MYTAKATDAAPNTSPASAARTITVDTVDPTVTDRSPLADATGVAVDVTVTAELSEALDPATVTATSVTLVGPARPPVPATVDYDERPTPSASTRPPTSPPARPTRSASARPSRTSPATTLAATSWDFATLNPDVCPVLAAALLVGPGEPAVQPWLGRG